MKKLLLIMLLFVSNLSLADAWDNLTMQEAEAVIDELKENPYVFDYCDCCDHEGEYATRVYLIQVLRPKIVTCEWNNEFYSVTYEYRILAEVKYTENGPDIAQMSSQEIKEYSEPIYMNYTWGLNKLTKKATPFFNIVEYDYYGADSEPCKPEFEYPTPKELAVVKKDKAYKKWWKKNVR